MCIDKTSAQCSMEDRVSLSVCWWFFLRSFSLPFSLSLADYVQFRWRHTSTKVNVEDMTCQCSIQSKKTEDTNKLAIPLTVVVSITLLLLVLSVLLTDGVIAHSFGTLDYFVAVSNSKRSTTYTVLLLVNVTMLVVSIVTMIVSIERSRGDKEVNKSQYNAVYRDLVKDTVLQMMAFTDLWARIPPSNALAIYKNHFVPTTTISNGPQTLGQMDASWTWFMTAEDVLEIAEDGFLFYYFSHDLPKLMETSGIAHELVKPLKQASGDELYNSGESHVEEGGIRPHGEGESLAVSGIQNHTLHHAYIAQRLSPQYWRGGVTFAPVPKAKRKYSFNGKPTTKAVVAKDKQDKAEAESEISSTANNDQYLEVDGSAESFEGFGTNGSGEPVEQEKKAKKKAKEAVKDFSKKAEKEEVANRAKATEEAEAKKKAKAEKKDAAKAAVRVAAPKKKTSAKKPTREKQEPKQKKTSKKKIRGRIVSCRVVGSFFGGCMCVYATLRTTEKPVRKLRHCHRSLIFNKLLLHRQPK